MYNPSSLYAVPGIQSNALFGDDSNYSQIPAQAMNPGAQNFTDVLLSGIAGAAINAANIATGVAPSATQQIQVQNQNFLALLIIGAVFFALYEHK